MGEGVEHDRAHDAQQGEDPDQPPRPVARAAGDHAGDRHHEEDDGRQRQNGSDRAHALYESAARSASRQAYAGSAWATAASARSSSSVETTSRSSSPCSPVR